MASRDRTGDPNGADGRGTWNVHPSREAAKWLVRFRWVECQLHALRKCLSVSTVRNALHNLPRTLDDTYARILNNIPQEYRREAHCALQLLTVSLEPLSLREVAEAVAVDCESGLFDPENRLQAPEALLEICSSLV